MIAIFDKENYECCALGVSLLGTLLTEKVISNIVNKGVLISSS